MDKLTFTERLQLEDIKELVENIILHPNRFMIEELLKFKKIYKNNINSKDISSKQKQYYYNIIENPELLNNDEEENTSDIPEFIESKEENTFMPELITVPFETKLSESDKKLINMDYPTYPCINKQLINNNFYLLANKLAYY